MGRWVALVILMGVIGCTDGDAPPLLVQDLGTSVTMDIARPGADLVNTSSGDGGGCDTTPCTPGGGGNAMCRNACGTSTAMCVAGSGGGSDHCMP